ncbi:hypothetical protein ACP3WJ_23320, partial [Salmonella enterica]|uniref:hypothetical protein n=1 Tax=Salmonella enterica TaxID=28901 RepID=UPI003CED52E7
EHASQGKKHEVFFHVSRVSDWTSHPPRLNLGAADTRRNASFAASGKLYRACSIALVLQVWLFCYGSTGVSAQACLSTPPALRKKRFRF